MLCADLHEQLTAIAKLKRDHMPLPDGVKFAGSEELVLHYGRSFDRDLSGEAAIPRLTPRNCFNNASALAMGDGRFVYCEGYAVSSRIGLGIHHAWVIDRQTGLALDPTWDVEFGEVAYIGVPLDLDFVTERRKTFGYAALFDAPNLGQFCMEGIPSESIVSI